MKLEYKVQELKHKLQKHLIEDKKKYDRTVEESGAKESKELYLENLQQKIKSIEDWLEGWDEVELLKSFVELKSVRTEQEVRFFRKRYTTINTLSLKEIQDFPKLPEGFYWKWESDRGYFNRMNTWRHSSYYNEYPLREVGRRIFTYDTPLLSLSSIRKLNEKFSGCIHWENPYLLKSLKLCTDTLPYTEVVSYKEPSDVRELLNKILLAEKHGCVKVTLEDKDLDVLMNIE